MKDGVEVLLYFNQLRDEINPIEAQSILHESKDDFSNNLPSHPPYWKVNDVIDPKPAWKVPKLPNYKMNRNIFWSWSINHSTTWARVSSNRSWLPLSSLWRRLEPYDCGWSTVHINPIAWHTASSILHGVGYFINLNFRSNYHKFCIKEQKSHDSISYSVRPWSVHCAPLCLCNYTRQNPHYDDCHHSSSLRSDCYYINEGYPSLVKVQVRAQGSRNVQQHLWVIALMKEEFNCELPCVLTLTLNIYVHDVTLHNTLCTNVMAKL